MPLPDVLLLALCVGIGGVCAAADCRVKRVPNRILLIGCLAAAILQAVRLCFFPSEQALPWLFSMIAADVMAVLLYAGHLWGAGDSKLFAFSYLCFPISLLSDSTLTNSFLPYIFIFLPAFFWTVLDSIHQAILRSKREADQEQPQQVQRQTTRKMFRPVRTFCKQDRALHQNDQKLKGAGGIELKSDHRFTHLLWKSTR